jgi:putative DNA primase/helicase
MQFVEAIAECGLGFPDIIADGSIHRFQAPDDKSRNSWYVMYEDVGVFGCWKRGITETWSNGKKLSGEAVKVAQKAIRDNLKEQHRKAAILANEMWIAGRPGTHPYLTSKRIPDGVLRVLDGVLLIPMYADDKIINIQRIYPDGSKRFLKGGQVKGCFAPIGNLLPPIAICEGYATGFAVNQHLGYSVAVAFNCHNLVDVAQKFRKRFPGKEIIICADNDWENPDNPGMLFGGKAAELIQAKMEYPDFPHTQQYSGMTDFWDFYYGDK